MPTADALTPVRSRLGDVRPSLLLFEPYFVLRHTVAAVAKDLGLAAVVEASSVDGALQMLRARPFRACILSVDLEHDGLELVRRLRAGDTASPAQLPIAVTTSTCDAGLIMTLKELRVARVMLKPFKVKVILETIGQMVDAAPLPHEALAEAATA